MREHSAPSWPCSAGRWERLHGTHCSCRVLAAAAGAPPATIDYGFCRSVLQKRWNMMCDHLPHVAARKATPKLPPHDVRDPVHALLIANADLSSD